MAGADHENLDQLRKSVETDADNAEARRRLIEALAAEGLLDEANSQAQALVELLPRDDWALELLAETFDQMGNTLGALRTRRRMRNDTPTANGTAEDPTGSFHPSQTDVPAPALRLLQTRGEPPEALGVPKEKLANIAGLATVKSHLERMIAMVRAGRQTTPSSWLGGALFYGPPSCGKKFCASVLAGELGADFVAVELASTPHFSELRSLIEAAAEGPHQTVMFLNDLDHLAMPAEAVAGALDLANKTGRLIVVGAATFPWHVSTMLVRRKRLDDILLVLPPDAPARHTFIDSRISGCQGRETTTLEWLVRHTDGHSFGEIEAILEAAKAADAGLASHESLRGAVQTSPPGSASWLTIAGHHALMNESSGLYDDLVAYFRKRQRHP